MTLKEEIEEVFKKYLRAIFSKDFESMYSVLYEDDAQKFRDTMIEFAHKMDEFGVFCTDWAPNNRKSDGESNSNKTRTAGALR